MFDSAVAGALCVGIAIGMLFAIFMFWDRQFNAGRAYGYREGERSRDEQEILDGLRGEL